MVITEHHLTKLIIQQMSNKIFYIFFLTVLSSAIFYGCSKEDDATVNPTGQQSPFTGHYKFQLEGSYPGLTEMDVTFEGNFDFPIQVTNSGISLTADITGMIKKNGIVTGTIKNDTIQIATFTGQIYSGEVRGYYSTSSGSSVWKMIYLY